MNSNTMNTLPFPRLWLVSCTHGGDGAWLTDNNSFTACMFIHKRKSYLGGYDFLQFHHVLMVHIPKQFDLTNGSDWELSHHRSLDMSVGAHPKTR